MRAMRRSERKLDETAIKDVLRRGEYAVLSVVLANARPYAVPISYVYDEETDAVYMHGALEGQKIDAISADANVCLTVVTDAKVLPDKFTTKYRSVNLFGTIELARDDDQKRRALLLLVRKYSADFEEQGRRHIDSMLDRTAVLKITIEEIFGKGRI